MVTSIAVTDIKTIRSEKEITIVKVRGGGEYKTEGVISFGIGAIFGQFHCIIKEEDLQRSKK